MQIVLTVAKEMILGGVDVSGAVRASAADYRGNYRTAFGGSHRQFSYYTQAET
jgi:hypothetical protein